MKYPGIIRPKLLAMLVVACCIIPLLQISLRAGRNESKAFPGLFVTVEDEKDSGSTLKSKRRGSKNKLPWVSREKPAMERPSWANNLSDKQRENYGRAGILMTVGSCAIIGGVFGGPVGAFVGAGVGLGLAVLTAIV